jgi:hypothetical protein
MDGELIAYIVVTIVVVVVVLGVVYYAIGKAPTRSK